jgi:hypothetical protein
VLPRRHPGTAADFGAPGIGDKVPRLSGATISVGDFFTAPHVTD